MNNPASILGAGATADWRRRNVESIRKRCVLALVLLFMAAAFGSVPSRQASAQDGASDTSTAEVKAAPNSDGETMTLRARFKAH